MTMLPTGDFPAGYQCPACGTWVYGGAFHTCHVPAVQPWPNPTGPQGWSCPHCGKAHAPWVQTCPEAAPATFWATSVGSVGSPPTQEVKP